MDITSYLLGKKAGGGGGGADLSEYFDDTITAGTSAMPGFANVVKKIKNPLTITGTKLEYAFNKFKGTEIPKLNGDMSAITNMGNMFGSCSNLTSLDTSYFDTSNVTAMYAMFVDCLNLTSLDLSSFDTSKVTNMNTMFAGCSNLTSLDLSSFDTSKVTTMDSMFQNCTNLTTLDLSSFNLSEVLSTTLMFKGCTNLTTLTLPNIGFSKASNIRDTFNGCVSLTSLDLSDFDFSKVTNVGNFLYNCTSLTNLTFGANLGAGYSNSSSAGYSNYTLDLHLSTNLTHDSLMSVINNIYDLATKGAKKQKLILGSTNLAKLTVEEIAIATNKGWTVS